MLPDGWRRVPLHEVAEVRTGVAKGKTGQRDPIELPYLRVANVQDGHVDLSEVKTITIEREHVDRYSLRQGDILMTEGGDFDKLGRGDVWQGQIEPCLHQNHVFAVRPLSRQVNSYFLAALAASHYGRSYFLSCAKRSTNLASINSSQLKAFPVLLPPPAEQKFIASALSTWDESIAATERLLACSRKQKQALVQQLLDAQRNTQGRAKGWRTYRLGELFTERVESGCIDLPLLSITREEGVINREDVGRKDTSNEDKSKYRRICPGDIGYNTMRMWQGVSALSDLEGIVSPAYTIVTPTPMIDGRFASYLFKLDRVVFEFYRHSQGLVSDTWNLKYPHFAKVKVTIPSRSEQEKIVAILSAADATIQTMAKEIEKLQVEKCALMQLLLTGKRRVRQSKSKTRTAA